MELHTADHKKNNLHENIHYHYYIDYKLAVVQQTDTVQKKSYCSLQDMVWFQVVDQCPTSGYLWLVCSSLNCI